MYVEATLLQKAPPRAPPFLPRALGELGQERCPGEKSLIQLGSDGNEEWEGNFTPPVEDVGVRAVQSRAS